VLFTASATEMQVSLVIPNQYETVKVEFEGALNDDATFYSVDINTFTYWSADYMSDPCNIYLTANIPVRSSAGFGV